MSICSDVYITRQEARQKVIQKLMYDQQMLIQLAVKAMDDFELRLHLNQNSDLYYYNIKPDKKKTKE